MGDGAVTSITDGMHAFNPSGDELDQVKRQCKGITALKKSGRTKQAQSAIDALVKAKTSRARKMPDGTTRAHTPTEVKAGLSQIGNLDLSGDHMSAIDLAGDMATRMLPDAAAVNKAVAKLKKLPPALQPHMKSMIVARAKALGMTVDLANTLKAHRTVDLSVPQAQRDAAKKAGLTFPGTDSYPLAGPDGKFSRSMATKAVNMVGLGNVGSAAAIRKWLMSKLKANGAGDLIPDAWSASGSAS
jgi:hypothetical protein